MNNFEEIAHINVEDDNIELDVELSLHDNVEPQNKTVSIQTLFDNNFHFGSKVKNRHKTMAQYVFCSKKDMDMIDLNKAAVLFERALAALRKCVARGGHVLFVGTESHSINTVKANAEKCAQFYTSSKWRGGLLTNWEKSMYPWVMSMKKLEKQIEEGYANELKTKERVRLLKKHEKFIKLYEGMKDMHGLPNMLVVTSHRQKNAIKEAEQLNIPIVMLADTSANVQNIRYVVPGNDCSIKAVELFCSYCANACLDGLKVELDRIQKRKEAAAKAPTPEEKPKEKRFEGERRFQPRFKTRKPGEAPKA